jgi:hypothetical protein
MSTKSPCCLWTDGSVLKQPVLPGWVFSTKANAASGRICSKAACAASARVCSSILQQTVLPLNVFVLQQPVLTLEVCLLVHLDCLSTRASAAPKRVCLQLFLCAPEVSADYLEPVLHLCVSVYCIRALCCTWKRLSSRAPMLHLCVSVYQSFVLFLCLFVLHLDVSAYKSPCMVYLEEHSLQTFFLFVSVVSICVRNTETNRKIDFLAS